MKKNQPWKNDLDRKIKKGEVGATLYLGTTHPKMHKIGHINHPRTPLEKQKSTMEKGLNLKLIHKGVVEVESWTHYFP
jgi:hypothetical protein